MVATTTVELLMRQVREHGGRPALRDCRGSSRAASWSRLADEVSRLAAGLARAGVGPGDRIVQLAENRYEWVLCDLAIQLAQAIHVPIHAPLAAEQVIFQIIDSGAQVVLISDDAQAAKLTAVAEQLPDGLQVYSFEPVRDTIGSARVAPIEELVSDHDGATVDGVASQALRDLDDQSLATILYTSGTTGEPKGVVLTQRNLVSNTLAVLQVMHQSADDRRLNLLPLSHIFARTCDLYTSLATGAELVLAQSRETVIADCAAVEPTLLNGVPFFFERVYRALHEQGLQDQPGALLQLFGGRMRMLCSGGAPLPDHLFDFYLAQGLPVYQGYGLTETSPVISVSGEGSIKRGAAGRPIPGIEVRFTEEGEILTRGPHVMAEYYRQPAATAEVLRDGWLSTGDLGHLDEEGFLFITGRKKEIIVTSGGKNVAPLRLEMLLSEDPLVLQAVVIGDRRDYLTALIVPNPDALRKEITRNRIALQTPEEALRHPDVLALYEQVIQARLHALSRHEQVRRFTLVNRAFTIETGEMTPKMSLRRQVIEANWAHEIEAMYCGSELPSDRSGPPSGM